MEIPGFGSLCLEHLVTDYTGTLAVHGTLIPGVRRRLHTLSTHLEIHVLTADTFGTALAQLEGIPCRTLVLTGPGEDRQKEAYVRGLGAERVAALGNGMNDRLMLRAAALGIAVTQAEGCAVEAITAARIHASRVTDALDLLLHPLRLRATLRT